jgi:peroxiredoxin
VSPTIQEQSNEILAASRFRLPTEVVETFARDQAAWQAKGRPADAVAVGDVLSDFTLPDATGQDVSLSKLVADGPAVLVFYRGVWCPYCNLALHQYQSELVPQLPNYGATLTAISPQKPDQSLTTIEKHNLRFAVLSDASARVARQLGIAFEPAADVLEAQRALGLDIRDGNADGSPELPMPTVLIVDSDRTVQFADVQVNYTSRTEVSEILAALQRLS